MSPDTLELTAQGRRLRAPAVVLGTGTAVLGRFLLAPLLPAIRDSLVLSSALAGSAVSLFALLSAITHFPAGRLADELSHQTVLIGGLSLLGIGSALLATTITTSQFLIALGLYGLGMGLFMPGGIVHLSAVFPERRGRVLGLNSGAAQLGGIGAALLSTVALARGSWQFAFIPVTGVIVLLTASIHIWRDQAYVVGRVQLDARETFGQLVVDADRRRAVLAAALLMIVMEGGFTFLPTFLRVSKSFPPSLASQAFGLIFVVGLVVNPLAGWGADHYRARTVAAGAVAVGIGGISTLTDAFYFTLVTASTVGYGDITPQSPQARLFGMSVVVLGTASFAIALGSLLGPAIEKRLSEALGNMTDAQLDLLENHVLVLGYGDLTEPIIEELAGAIDFVVITPDTEAATRLQQQDINVLTADPSDEEPLQRAGIEDASAVVAATNDDAQDALAILTAQTLNPAVNIVAAATDRENIEKLRRAGAETVISPAVLGGHLIVQSALGREGMENIADHLLDVEEEADADI